MMQKLNWNDLRYLLAVERGRSLSAAARLLGVDDTTVSRRLKALEAGLGARLVIRNADATLQLTEIAARVSEHAAAIEHQVGSIAHAIGEARGKVLGTVWLTAVPMVVNRLLVPALAGLLRRHDQLDLELVPDHRDLSLTRRQADLAIRLARPSLGGAEVGTRRMGLLTYGVYAARTVTAEAAARLPWIAYDDSMAHLPQARWLARHLRRHREPVSGLKVLDAETAVAAAACGIGRALLPAAIAARDERLAPVPCPAAAALPVREVWLLFHAGSRDLESIRTVIDWVDREAVGCYLDRG